MLSKLLALSSGYWEPVAIPWKDGTSPQAVTITSTATATGSPKGPAWPEACSGPGEELISGWFAGGGPGAEDGPESVQDPSWVSQG